MRVMPSQKVKQIYLLIRNELMHSNGTNKSISVRLAVFVGTVLAPFPLGRGYFFDGLSFFISDQKGKIGVLYID
jgi:hypothetical protein